MIDSESILKYLADNKKRYEQDFNLTKIGIFGSIARGDFNNDSDIDIVVEFKSNTPDLNTKKNNLKAEIQKRFNMQVDICRLKYIKPIFKEMIQSDIKYV